MWLSCHVLDYSRPNLFNLCSIWQWSFEPNLSYDTASVYASTVIFCYPYFIGRAWGSLINGTVKHLFQTSWCYVVSRFGFG